MRKFALTIAAILVMGSAFGQVWSYDWHGAKDLSNYEGCTLRGNSIYSIGYYQNFYPWFDLDPTSGIDSFPSIGNWNAYVEKMNLSGSYEWSIDLHGRNIHVYDIAVNSLGNIVVGGFSEPVDLDLDPTPNVVGATNSFSQVGFLATYDANGNFISHIEYDFNSWYGYRLAFDEADNLYVAGSFRGLVDFDFTGGSDIRNASSGDGVFLTKLNPTLGQYAWTRTVGELDSLTDVWVQELDISGDKVVLLSSFAGASVDLDPSPSSAIFANASSQPGGNATTISLMDTSGGFLRGGIIGAKLNGFEPWDASISSNGAVSVVGVSLGIDDSLKVMTNGPAIPTIFAKGGEPNLLIHFDSNLDIQWAKVFRSNTFCSFEYLEADSEFIYINGYCYDSLIEIENGIERSIAISQSGVGTRTLVGYQSNGTLMGVEADTLITPVIGNPRAFPKGLEFDSNQNIFILANFNLTVPGEFDLDPGIGVATPMDIDSSINQYGSYILKLNFNGFVNTQKPEAPAKVVAYPNPATQDLRIQSESPFSKVTLQDLQGRVLMSQTFDAVQSHMLDLSAISRGVYLLTIEGEIGRVTSKVVKQ